jgi:hypothetical protein
MGLPRFEVESPGIEQGKYYLITASKVGKTQIADHLFLYNSVKQMMDNDLPKKTPKTLTTFLSM